MSRWIFSISTLVSAVGRTLSKDKDTTDLSLQKSTLFRRRAYMNRSAGLSIAGSLILLYYIFYSGGPPQTSLEMPNDFPRLHSAAIHSLSSADPTDLTKDDSGLTTIRLEMTQDLCKSKIDQKTNVKQHHLILWTRSVSESARRTLHSGFDAFRILSENATQMDDLSELLIDDQCWAFTDLARITHAAPPKTLPEEVMFGVASTKERLLVPHAVTTHWLRNASTNFYVHVPKNDHRDAEDRIQAHYRNYGLLNHYVGRDTHDIDQTLQYARLSATMYELTQAQKLENVKWFVHLDDDTLLTSVEDYTRMLDAYDSSLPIYIGANSESAVTMARDGRGAWGGASIAVSRALAAQLSARWLECTTDGRMDHSPYGDHKLDGCVAHLQGRSRMQPDIKLEHSLHQLDFFGSIDGYLRSGVKWLTMHHFGWVNLFPYPDGPGGTPAKVQKIVNSAKFLGSDNLFSNYLLKHDEHGAIVLTNGYAVTQYLVPLSRHELEMVEKTFMENVQDDYQGAVGPTRPPKQEGSEKRTFFIDSVKERVVNDVVVGSTWTYKYDRDNVAEDIVLDWLL